MKLSRRSEIHVMSEQYMRDITRNAQKKEKDYLTDKQIQFAVKYGAEWADANPKKVWHNADELPNFDKGVTEFIVDSMYGHISSVAHTYTYEHWKNHIEFIGNCGYKWAYEKDLITEK